jgi:asparagine synthetase B (glutamine-hydrolysing)
VSFIHFSGRFSTGVEGGNTGSSNAPVVTECAPGQEWTFETPYFSGNLKAVSRACRSCGESSNVHVVREADGQFIFALFSGFMANRRELSENLAAVGEAAILSQLWLRCGSEALKALDGAFAAVIVDSRHESVCLVRDCYGQAPLFRSVEYSVDGECTRFAVATRPMLPDGRVPEAASMTVSELTSALDPRGVDCFFAYNYFIPPLTVFRGCRAFMGGEIWKAKASGDSFTGEWNFTEDRLPFPWSFEGVGASEHEEHITSKSICDELKDILGAASAQAADLNVCAFCGRNFGESAVLLSGGIDSTAIAVSVAEKRLVNRSFSLSFPGSVFDEADKFIALISALNMESIVCNMSPDVMDCLPAVLEQMGHPVGDASFLAMAEAGKAAASSGIAQLLTGDGGDELAGGYSRMEGLGKGLPFNVYLRRLFLVPPTARYALYSDQFRNELMILEDLELPCASMGNSSEHSDDPDRACIIDLLTLMPGNNGPKTLLMLAMNNVTPAAPLMSAPVARFLTSLPSRWRNSGSESKAILREFIRSSDVLRQGRSAPGIDLSRQTKRMLTVPVGEWYSGPFREQISQWISSGDSLIEETIFRCGTLDKTFMKHLETGETRVFRAILAMEVFMRILTGREPHVPFR